MEISGRNHYYKNFELCTDSIACDFHTQGQAYRHPQHLSLPIGLHCTQLVKAAMLN